MASPSKFDALIAALSIAITGLVLTGFESSSCFTATGKTSLKTITIDLSEESYKALKTAPKIPVPAVISFQGLRPRISQLHLKGSGTFQGIDRKPNFTCKIDWDADSIRSLHFSKFYLHNSAQDYSLLADFSARKIYERFKIPVGELGFASVRLNGKDLGMYTLAEGINHAFLTKHYGSSSGALLEGDRFQDVEELLWGVNNNPVSQVSNAFPSVKTRISYEELGRIISADYLCANTDGYVFENNNYWVYWDECTEFWRVFPHTSDGAFSQPHAALRLTPQASPVKRLLAIESERRKVLRMLAEACSPPEADRLVNEISCEALKLLSEIRVKYPEEYAGRARAASTLIARIRENITDIRRALDLESGKIDCTDEYRNPSNWKVVLGSSDKKMGYSAAGSTITVARSAEIPLVVVEAPVYLRPGLYRFESWCRSDLSSSRIFTRIALGVGTFVKDQDILPRKWYKIEDELRVPSSFEGKLFQIEATSVELRISNLVGCVSVDLGRTRIERLRD